MNSKKKNKETEATAQPIKPPLKYSLDKIDVVGRLQWIEDAMLMIANARKSVGRNRS